MNKLSHHEQYLDAGARIYMVVAKVKSIREERIPMSDLDTSKNSMMEDLQNDRLGEHVFTAKKGEEGCSYEVDYSLTCLQHLNYIANVLKNNKCVANDVLSYNTLSNFVHLACSPRSYNFQKFDNREGDLQRGAGRQSTQEAGNEYLLAAANQPNIEMDMVARAEAGAGEFAENVAGGSMRAQAQMTQNVGIEGTEPEVMVINDD